MVNGRLTEWSIVPVLKTGVPQGTVGSNPTSSAKVFKLFKTKTVLLHITIKLLKDASSNLHNFIWKSKTAS